MLRHVFAVAASLYASTLIAEEEIYLRIKYVNDENGRVSHKMQCQDSRCTVKSNAAEQPVDLTGTQRAKILEAFQAELGQLDLNSKTESGNRPVKIKFRYRSGSRRVDFTQYLPADQLSGLSTELIAVFETHFPDLDLFSPRLPESTASDEQSVAPANKKESGSR